MGGRMCKLDKAKRSYQEAVDNEGIEQLAAYGFDVCVILFSFFFSESYINDR
jgi:hypothetical protein